MFLSFREKKPSSSENERYVSGGIHLARHLSASTVTAHFLSQFVNCVDSAQFVKMKEFVWIGGLLEEESGSWCLLGIKLNT